MSLQFKYATAFDWLLMFLATVASILHGAALPCFTIIFGRFINTFISQAVTTIVIAFANQTEANDPMACLVQPFPDSIGETVEIGIQSETCTYNVTADSTVAMLISQCASAECLLDGDFINEVNILVYIFIGIAVGVFTLAYFEISLYQTACERQVKKIRLAFYRAIMRQEVGWFDANPSGELASRIAE